MTNESLTHQQRWRSRLRATHDRVDVYLPTALATTLRRHVTGEETVSMLVERSIAEHLP